MTVAERRLNEIRLRFQRRRIKNVPSGSADCEIDRLRTFAALVWLGLERHLLPVLEAGQA